MEVDVVKSSGKKPGQSNANGSSENVLDRDSQWDKLRHGTRRHSNGELLKGGVVDYGDESPLWPTAYIVRDYLGLVSSNTNRLRSHISVRLIPSWNLRAERQKGKVCTIKCAEASRSQATSRRKCRTRGRGELAGQVAGSTGDR
jgi:hypothetical protein